MSLSGSVRQCRSGTSSGLDKSCQLNEGPVLHGKVGTVIVLQGYQLIIVSFLQLGCKSFWLFLFLCHWFIMIGCIYHKGVLLRCQNWSVQSLSESVLQLKKLSSGFCGCMPEKCMWDTQFQNCKNTKNETQKKPAHKTCIIVIPELSSWSDGQVLRERVLYTCDVKYLLWDYYHFYILFLVWGQTLLHHKQICN